MIDLAKARSATQAIFLVCGFGVSSWAPMVPYAKDRLGLNDGSLGLLLLFLGVGAITMMPVTGYLIHKVGTRKVMAISALIIALTLPLLLLMTAVIPMAVALFLFGSGIGAIDVAMNAHGVQIQNLYNKPIMSSLHGLFSVGGLCGSIGIGLLIKLGLQPLIAASCISVLLLVIVSSQLKNLMDAKTESGVIKQFSTTTPGATAKKGSWLNGALIFLGLVCFAAFLSEGAMLDWSAIFLRDYKGIDEALAGIGYASFSVAMATMRLVGDRIISRIDAKFVVIYGGLIGAAGLALAILTPWLITALLGFILLGIGAANIVPVFFSEAGRLKNVSSSIAIPVMTTMGYAGQLTGPAILGFIAHHFSLPVALGFTAFLLLFVSVGWAVKKSKKQPELTVC
jgi:predicted MFS family arabinose efflux permease